MKVYTYIDCHLSCLFCYNNTEFDCVRCDANHGYYMDYSQEPIICTLICPKGYYGSYEDAECKPCSRECATCINKPNMCLLCNAKLKYSKASPNSYQCTPLVCPIGTYEQLKEGEYRCQPCHPNCKACIGESVLECTACKNFVGYISQSTQEFTLKDTYGCYTCEEYDSRLVTPGRNSKLQCDGIAFMQKFVEMAITWELMNAMMAIL